MFGLAADQPDATFMWSITGPDRYAAIRLRRPQNPSGVLYELLATHNLATPWLPVATIPVANVPLGGGLEHAIFREPLPATASRKFLRIRMTWAP